MDTVLMVKRKTTRSRRPSSCLVEPKMLQCPYGEEMSIRNPFWDAAPSLNSKLEQKVIRRECIANSKRIGYFKNPKKIESLMRKVRPELAGVLNSSKNATSSDAVLFADLYVWYIVADDLLESLQDNSTTRNLYSQYDQLLSKICFEGFGFSIGTSGKARDSIFPKTAEQTECMQGAIDGINDILRRAVSVCTNNLQYLNLCREIERYVGANAFESLQRTKQDTCLGEDRTLKRYGQMRCFSIGQGMSMEMALILRGIYVPTHLRQTTIFQEAWNAGIEFIWKMNDLIGCARDAKARNPINSVNLIGKQRGLSLSEARQVYNKEIYEPAVERLRRAYNPRTLISRMKKELITDRYEQQVLRNAFECFSNIHWASFKWNMTVARYAP